MSPADIRRNPVTVSAVTGLPLSEVLERGRWVSVDRPGLDLETDDVWACELCEGAGEVVMWEPDRYGGFLEHTATCPECRGYRFIHGFSDAGPRPATRDYTIT